MFVFVSSADKDIEKTFDGFNRMHMIWIDIFENEAQRGQGPITFTQFKRFKREDIAISECCRGQNTNICIYQNTTKSTQ